MRTSSARLTLQISACTHVGWLYWNTLSSQTEIDQARDREKALAFHRTSTQFGEFMDKLLLEIGEYRKGGVDEPELVAADP